MVLKNDYHHSVTVHRVYIVEQTGSMPFNRGKLLNIGYLEAKKRDPHSNCFIFHDVDLLPLNLQNIYACSHLPRHMSSSIDTFRFNLPYLSLCGGAVSILDKQFEMVNGFSNLFYGWGGEDDDFANRLKEKHLEIIRLHPRIARYTMLQHQKQIESSERLDILSHANHSEGLNSTVYKVQLKELPLYTHLFASL